MRSAMAGELARRRQERLARMTPAECVLLAIRMGEEGLASYMATHGVDRATAVARIKATRRMGRRPSGSADSP
jgi:hypothetical protein